MKLLKLIFVLFVVTTLTNCSSNDTVPTLTLSTNSIAGTYNISSFNSEAVLSTEVTPGISATISTVKIVGDTFQIDFTLNTDGSYTSSGQYRIETTVAPVTGNPVTTPSIVNFSDSGNFSINSNNNTITFSSSTDEFLSGTFEVVSFNDTSFGLSQETEEINDPITTTINTNISFVRK